MNLSVKTVLWVSPGESQDPVIRSGHKVVCWSDLIDVWAWWSDGRVSARTGRDPRVLGYAVLGAVGAEFSSASTEPSSSWGLWLHSLDHLWSAWSQIVWNRRRLPRPDDPRSGVPRIQQQLTWCEPQLPSSIHSSLETSRSVTLCPL